MGVSAHLVHRFAHRSVWLFGRRAAKMSEPSGTLDIRHGQFTVHLGSDIFSATSDGRSCDLQLRQREVDQMRLGGRVRSALKVRRTEPQGRTTVGHLGAEPSLRTRQGSIVESPAHEPTQGGDGANAVASAASVALTWPGVASKALEAACESWGKLARVCVLLLCVAVALAVARIAWSWLW
jgi:hypothetical protein